MAAGDMTKLAASDGDIDTSDQLQMTEAYGKVFIANGSNLKVADFQNTKLTTGALGANPPDRGNILTGGTSGAEILVDYVTALSSACTIYGYRITAATFVDTETVTGTDDDGNAVSFVLTADEVAPPHWYDWTIYGNDEGLYGSMPDQAYLVGVSGGRLILSGDRDHPHQAPTSASGNPWDWNHLRTSVDRAAKIGTGDAGAIGDVVRAIIPVRDGQIVFGCANSIHVMVGNPAFGGQLVAVDKAIGIFDGTSWCFDGEGGLYFWGSGGLHKMDRNSLAVDTVNKISLPNLVNDTAADPSTHRITMGYDPVRIGIKICVTLLADGTSQNYWYDVKTEGLFPEIWGSDLHGVYSLFNYNANDPDYKGLLMGCTDGYIRVHDDTEENDDGTAIDSYVDYGPIPLAEDGKDGSLAAFDVVLAGGASGGSATDSDDVSVQVWAEDVAETVLEKLYSGGSTKLSFTFGGPGRKRGGKRRRGVRGAYAGIKIGNSTAGETWGFEKILLDGGTSGRRLR
ncbi:MAG: hypothetical protein GQ565_02930 [Candidatus Aegiribacteria sp.]|nr:hypothetical protein [Candidatus Aegiribacteria sp.]